MNWRDSHEIALALFEANPELDPLSLRFADLHKMIIELPDFDNNPDEANEAILEEIQMAWLDEYQG